MCVGREGAAVTTPSRHLALWYSRVGVFQPPFRGEIHPLTMLRFLAWRILMLSSNTRFFVFCFFHPHREELFALYASDHSFLATSWSFLLISLYPTSLGLSIIVKWAWRTPYFGKHSQSVFYLSETSSTLSLLALSTFLWGILAVLFTEGLWVSRTLHWSVVTLVLTLNLSKLSFSIHTTLLLLATLRGGCEGYMR